MDKLLFRGYSLGAWYYCHASSLREAVSLLRNKALQKVGRYVFNEGYQRKDINGWVKVFE